MFQNSISEYNVIVATATRSFSSCSSHFHRILPTHLLKLLYNNIALNGILEYCDTL